MEHDTTKRITLSNLLALGLCVGVLGAAAIPGLADLRQRMRASLCANNLRACVQAWNVYAAVNADTWMHHWDRSYAAVASYGGEISRTQSPVHMWYYVKGEIPPGQCYVPGQGWWDYRQQEYEGSTYPDFLTIANNPQFHCPEMLGNSKFMYFENVTSYSWAIYQKNYGSDAEPAWWDAYGGVGGIYYYPKPSLFTHASTTVMIHDMVLGDGGVYLLPWSSANSGLLGQHGGRSNVSFCDGHVETADATNLSAFGEWAFRPYAALPAE